MSAAPKGRIVEMSVALRPTAQLQGFLDRAKEQVRAAPAATFDKPRIGEGTIELRVALAPPQMGMPRGTYVWGVVESYEGGHQEILIGGGKPTLMEASVEGSAAFESLLNTLGKKG